jgi:hypothetical protein
MANAVDPRVLILEAELARVRGEVERAISAIPPDKMHKAPAPGVWSPAQIIWHLAKIERSIARLLERLDGSLNPMTTVPPGPRRQAVLKVLDKYPIHDRSRRLEAPENARPPEEIDVAAELGRLRDGREQLLAILRAAGPRLSLHHFDHMYFGALDGWQWGLFVARHEERHMAQLAETLAKLQ